MYKNVNTYKKRRC